MRKMIGLGLVALAAGFGLGPAAVASMEKLRVGPGAYALPAAAFRPRYNQAHWRLGGTHGSRRVRAHRRAKGN